MFDPPILDGAKTFWYIAIALISVVHGVALLDVIKNTSSPKKGDDHKE